MLLCLTAENWLTRSMYPDGRERIWLLPRLKYVFATLKDSLPLRYRFHHTQKRRGLSTSLFYKRILLEEKPRFWAMEMLPVLKKRGTRYYCLADNSWLNVLNPFAHRRPWANWLIDTHFSVVQCLFKSVETERSTIGLSFWINVVNGDTVQLLSCK